MPDHKRTVRTATSGSNDTLVEPGPPGLRLTHIELPKPEPPADLWEQLSELLGPQQKPKDCFTQREFAEKFGKGERSANDQIRKLVRQGALIIVRPATGNIPAWYRVKK